MSKPLPPPLLTLFTHPSCSLCTSAKYALSRAWELRPFQYEEVDVQSAEAERDGWDLYRLDVPVLHIQWEKGVGKRRVMMHKVEESEILRLIKEVEAEHLAEVAEAEAAAADGSGTRSESGSERGASGSENESSGSTAGSEVGSSEGSPKLS